MTYGRAIRPISGDTRDVFVYDADCGFCTTTAMWMSRNLLRPGTPVEPWQSLELADHGLTLEEVASAAYWVDDSGTHRGHLAIARALETSRAPFPIVGKALRLPGVSQLASRVYDLVAANRYRLPGSTDACKIDLT